jgi:lipopolysaccharide export system permease protein
LTLIGVTIASRKVRGGVGMHIMLGFLVCGLFILFLQISSTFAISGAVSPFVAVWIPNIIFTVLGLYLLKIAQK